MVVVGWTKRSAGVQAAIAARENQQVGRDADRAVEMAAEVVEWPDDGRQPWEIERAKTNLHRDDHSEFLLRDPDGTRHGRTPRVDSSLVGEGHGGTRGCYQRGRLRRTVTGAYDTREACLELLKGLPLLAILPPIAEIVEGYFAHQLMPRDPAGDALHLALASYYRCDFLVTWNCRHLANANKFDHIRRVNGILGIHVPSLVTPLELLED